MSGSVPVIDADSHLVEPPAVWQDYAEPAFRELVIQVRRGGDGDELWIEGRRHSRNPAPSCIPGALSDPETPVTWDDLLPGGHNPLARLAVLDEEGFAQGIFFPTIYLLAGDIQDPAVAAATARAYNNWVANFCDTDPSRLVAFGIAPLQDVGLAAAEVERAAGLGLPGVTVRPERYKGLAVHDPACERFWAAAQDSDMTVVFHGSFGTRMESFATSRYSNIFFTHMICHPFEQMAAMLDLICGGVLERFPRLRVGFFEAGLGWLPYWLERMDEHVHDMGHLVPGLTCLPTEYFRDHCFVTWEPEEIDSLRQLNDMGLGRCVLWGSDYPHFDCVYPGALSAAEKALAQFEPAVSQNIFHDNAIRFARLSTR